VVFGAITMNYPCFDCQKELKVKKSEIQGGKMLVFGERVRFKCDECFTKNPKWQDPQECEVYSRIVGYLRPLSQWHKGKIEEYKDRVPFKI